MIDRKLEIMRALTSMDTNVLEEGGWFSIHGDMLPNGIYARWAYNHEDARDEIEEEDVFEESELLD